MADIFLQDEVRQLLQYKTVYFMGDSNTRGVYKDLVQLSGRNSLLTDQALKSKLEESFNGDELGFHTPASNGIGYREERSYKNDGFLAKFIFLTRCYNRYVESILAQMVSTPPDVVIYNSCLWDMSRYGPNSVSLYKENIAQLLKRLRVFLPRKCLFIWTTTLPLSAECYGGFLTEEVKFMKHTLRFHVIEANWFASRLVAASGYDVLDLHYHAKFQIHRRAKDGIHWQPHVVRFITNLILTHISLAWEVPLPGRFKSNQLSIKIDMQTDSDEDSSADQPDQRDQFCLESEPIVQLRHQEHNRDNRFCPPLPDSFEFGNMGNQHLRNFQNMGNQHLMNFQNMGNENLMNFQNMGNENLMNFQNMGNENLRNFHNMGNEHLRNFPNMGNENIRNFPNMGNENLRNFSNMGNENLRNFPNMGNENLRNFETRGNENLGNFQDWQNVCNFEIRGNENFGGYENLGNFGDRGRLWNFEDRDNGNFGRVEDPGHDLRNDRCSAGPSRGFQPRQFPNPFDAVPDRTRPHRNTARRGNRARRRPRDGKKQRPYNRKDY